MVPLPPYELLIKVGSATSCAIFLALWNIVQASNAVEDPMIPPALPKAILMFHKLHSNAKPCQLPPICEAQDVP